MVTISLCMIVNNDSGTLEKCLNSVKSLVDEIIIVDTGSIDNTKDIAYCYTDKVYDYCGNSNAEAKNFGFSKATCDYIMWLGANEYLTNLNIKYFKDYKEKLEVNYDAIMMKNELCFDNNGRCNQWNYSERLVKRSKNFIWQGDIHEFLIIMGSITYSDIAIQKIKAEKNIKEIQTCALSKKNKYEDDIAEEDMFECAKEYYNSDDITEAINWLNKFIMCNIDDIKEKIEASLLLSDCYKINGEELNRLNVLINTLCLDILSPNVFNSIANYFYDHKFYNTAIIWYKCVIDCKKQIQDKSINMKEYIFKAYIGICESYKCLDNNDKAFVYHKRTKKLRPNDIKVIENEKYFNKIYEETTV